MEAKLFQKLGGFASHGCVGLTNSQIKDFARMLARISGTEVTDKMVASYLADKTRTRVVKLSQTVPVELRYETIVVEDGKLHIFKDVYDQNTNTEENLRKVLEANSLSWDSLSTEEKTKVSEALNAMSAHPQKIVTATPSTVESNTNDRSTKKPKAKPSPTASAKKQKEIVIDITGLAGHGYPAPVDLDTERVSQTSLSLIRIHAGA